MIDKPLNFNIMKRVFFLISIAIVPFFTLAQTNKSDSIFIKITDENIFSKCFANSDLNNDGIVTYKEAEQTTMLYLDRGGRMNIISDYKFLKYFPNLTHLSIGNTPNESIDLSNNPKLEVIDLRNGLWIQEVTIRMGCNPQIFFPINEQAVVFKRVSVPEKR